MDLFVFPKLNGEPISYTTDLQYEGNTVVVSLFPIDTSNVERLLKAGLNDVFGVSIGTSDNVISLGRIHNVNITKIDSAVDEFAELELTIKLTE